MEPLMAFGAVDKNGQPKEPTYVIGPVTEKKGTKLPGTGKAGQCNHADYIDETGY